MIEERHYSQFNDAVSIEELLEIIEGKDERTEALRDCPGLYEAYCRYKNSMLLLQKYFERWLECPLRKKIFTKPGRRQKAKMMAMSNIYDKRLEEYEFLYKLYV